MNELILRQGTVYEHRESTRRILVVNHNPMALEALLLTADTAESPFDLGSVRTVGIDALIALRRSGEYRELGDLPAADFQRLLQTLLAAPGLPDALRTQLETLRAS